MLKSALNAILSLHSREATLKRLGTPDIYSPCRVSPSNYHRNQNGPEYTTIKGTEYIIPLDSLTGHQAFEVHFNGAPDSGSFKISLSGTDTAFLPFDSTAMDIQEEIRAIPGFEYAECSGDFASGFIFTMVGSQDATLTLKDYSLQEMGEDVPYEIYETASGWSSPEPKRGDRLLLDSRVLAITEVIILHDLGATPMGYRVRVE